MNIREMDKAANFLFITHVEKEGPFLKVWGQVDKATAINVEQALLRTTPHFEKGYSGLPSESLQNGVLCCAKYKDGKYYRARIIGTDQLVVNGCVEVSFLDFGNRDLVPSADLRSMQNFTSSFISLPPLAASFLLAETVCASGEWNELFFQEIVKELRYTEVNYTLVAQAVKHLFVRLSVNGQDVSVTYINRGLMARTSLHTQEAVLLTMVTKPPAPAQPPPAAVPPPAVAPAHAVQAIAAYKAFTLEPGTQHPVYVSYISDGPCHFSVQLKQTEDILVKLMNDINSMPLKPLDECPLPGTVCVARCIEDGHICRAVVTNEVDSQFKVFYVDFGNSEVVPLEALFQIPFKYVIPKVMAVRFALAGIEKSTLTIEMKCAFKQFVDNRLLFMKVIPAGQRTALPKCELYDPVTKTGALDVLHRAAVNAYPDPPALNRGFSQPVRVSYVYSCSRFYVQLKTKEGELTQLMIDLQNSCLHNSPMNPDAIKEGLPCCALYEGDGQWYRSLIVDVCDGVTVKVRYIDYGNEEIVPISLLKLVEGEQLTVLRPQAIECCLNGYQNMGEDQERDNLLEEIILEKEFTMKVIEMQSGRALVDLIDGSNYNVASLLLEKIASARSQVSPMLVQAGNRIEHRKSITSPSQNYGKDKKPARDSNKGWNEKTNDSTSWRQENKDKPFRNREVNEHSNEPSWRQNKENNFRNKDKDNRFNKNDDHSPRGGGRSFNDNASTPTTGDSWGETSPQQNVAGGDTWDSNSNADQGGYRKKDRSDDSNKNFSDKGGGYGGFKGRAQDRNKNPKYDNNRGGDGHKKEWDNKASDGWGDSKGDDGQNGGGASEWDSKGRGDSWGGQKEDKGGGDWKDKGKGKWDKGGDRDKGDSWGGGKEKGGKWGDKTNSWDKGDNKDSRFKGNKSDGWSKDSDGSSKWQNDDNKENSFDKQNNTWDAGESPRSGGQGFKKNFQRQNSELSSSGSERGFQKGSKSRKYEPRNKKPERSPPKGTFEENTWSAPAPTADNFEAAPSTANFGVSTVGLGTEVSVLISWFHNPGYFYVQLTDYETQLKKMMEEIQVAYKRRKAGQAECNAPVISIFPEDKVLYRARVLEVIGTSYKVFYVDFGNVAVVDQVWPVETRFMELPAQAICCGLNCIEPAGQHWHEASTYSQYFDKERFQCKFIANDKGRYLVEMAIGGDLVAELLARDCVAKYNVKPDRTLNLDVMVNQRFWAIVRSINSLNDILIQTSRNEILTCSVFMHEEAEGIYIQNLQLHLNKQVIVQVHAAHNDRLQVNFYDEQGNKIQVNTPDNDIEPISILLEHPVFTKDVHAYVSETSGNLIYVQPNEYLDDLSNLEARLTKTYDTNEEQEADEPQQCSYYALKDGEKPWRRVMFLNKVQDTNGKVNVEFIDYGFKMAVDGTSLRPLTIEFQKVPRFCFEVMHHEVNDQRGAEVILVNIHPKDTLQTTAFNVGSIKLLNAVPHSDGPCEEGEVMPVPVDSTHVPVTLCHVDTPNDFYLQKSQDHDTISEVMAQLSAEVEEMQVLENASVGVRCAAPYSVDDQWYRAEVLDADDDITTVRFIDYGNTDVLSNDTVKVRALPPKLLMPAVYATRCSLRATPVDEEWSPEAMDVLTALLDADDVTARFVDQDEKTNYVELYHQGRSVRELLVTRKLAHNCAALQEGQKGFISHINSPSEFFIQLECYSGELERFSEQLSNAENFVELTDLSPGSLCAAMYTDEQWYRARILSNTVAGIEVLFIDFGNSAVSANLRQLPEELALAAPLAQKCSLLKPPGLICWSSQAAQAFADIAADGETVFVVEKISSGETSVVRLMLEGQDVVEMLRPQTVSAQVTNVRSIELFDLSYGTDVVADVKLETLPGTLWMEESTEDFKDALKLVTSNVDIEFVNDTTVRIYIEGLNDIRQQISREKINTSQVNDSVEDDGLVDEIYTDQHVQAIEEKINNSGDASGLSHGDLDVNIDKPRESCDNEVETPARCGEEAHNIVTEPSCTEERQFTSEDGEGIQKTEMTQADNAETGNNSELTDSDQCDDSHLVSDRVSNWDGQTDALHQIIDSCLPAENYSNTSMSTASVRDKSEENIDTSEEICAPNMTSTPEKLQGDAVEDLVKSDTTEDSPAKSDVAEGSPDKFDATEGSLAKSDVTEGSPAKSNVTEGSPDKFDATEGSPAKSDATEGSPVKSDITEGSPAKSDATEGSPAKSDATEVSPAKSNTAPKTAAEEITSAKNSPQKILLNESNLTENDTDEKVTENNPCQKDTSHVDTIPELDKDDEVTQLNDSRETDTFKSPASSFTEEKTPPQSQGDDQGLCSPEKCSPQKDDESAYSKVKQSPGAQGNDQSPSSQGSNRSESSQGSGDSIRSQENDESSCSQETDKKSSNLNNTNMKLILDGIVDGALDQLDLEPPPLSPHHRMKNSDEQIVPGVISRAPLTDSDSKASDINSD